MISETATNVTIRVSLSSGKGVRIEPGVDRFTILDSGVLMVECGDYKVSYFAPGQWDSIQVVDQDSLRRSQIKKFGNPGLDEEGRS
jgi:hypothetical protein